MRTHPPLLPTVLSLAILLVTPATAQKIATDYDHSATFSDYHTYAWTSGTPVKDQLLDQRICSSIDKQLAAKGYRKVSEPEQADILVTYNAALDQQMQYNTIGMGGWNYGWGMGSHVATTTLNTLPVGVLDVRIGDNRTHSIVWRGTASGILGDKSARAAQQIKEATTKMFSRYPPKRMTLFSSSKSFR
ncbi:MAG TPA: DUF4136 domain-containing protein [Edaphobacter sp.]|jgi:hypothetical protein